MKKNNCSSCSKGLLQKPKERAFVMFVGLSAKPEANDLCPTTNTGKLISAIEERIAGSMGIYRTNAVKCAPLDSAGKLRYPTESELKACLPRLLAEIESVSPKVVVPLGGIVSRFLLQSLGEGRQFSGFGADFDYETYPLDLGYAMPIHHPSYIWIYRRKRVNEYVERVVAKLSSLVTA